MRLDLPYPDVRQDLNRWLPLIKWFLAIPHYVVLFFLDIAIAVVDRLVQAVRLKPLRVVLVGRLIAGQRRNASVRRSARYRPVSLGHPYCGGAQA